ncbi:MAG: ligase, partial [Enterovirga sp.]|nr:ligase [Enterovirga sp.]
PDQPDILEEQPLSVVTGRSLDEIASDRGSAVWQSNRAEPEAEPQPKRPAPAARKAASPRQAGAPRRKTVKAAVADGEPDRATAPAAARAKKQAGKAALPSAVEPALATLVATVPEGPNWVHEIKWDGYRLIVFKTDEGVRVTTRRGHDWTARFPGIAEAVAALPADTVILDGEAIIEGPNGTADFSALQNALSDEHGKVARTALLYAFDLLFLDGVDLRELPLEDRKARLSGIVPAGATGTLRLSEHIESDGGAMLRNACRLGLEGIISKRRDRPYRSGRTQDWVKIKCAERQEFVVGGYVPSTASARAVGSLVLGYYESGKLKHAGRSGTGFTADSARAIWRKLDAAARPTSPFGDRLTAAERRGVVWVEPVLAAEIEFRGWTGEGRLRHAAFKGLREDKNPADIVREMPRDAAPDPDTAPAGSTPAPAPPRRGRVKHGAEVAGVALTHPERVLWEEGITKQQLAEFYERIADRLLPHLVGRPLSLVRCPDGVGKSCFFQKHAWAGLGPDIKRRPIPDKDGVEEILYVEDIRGVVSLVQASVLEIHPWGSTVADVERPDRITMDLDPAEDVAWTEVIAAARDVRERLLGVGLESFVKTTGGKGLHVVVPLTPKAGWDEVKGFAQALALAMEADSPGRYLSKASKQARRGLIYVDYLRNGRGATAIGAYSTRARPSAPVSVPLGWDELSPGLKGADITLASLPARLERSKADPWAEIGRIRQLLPDLSGGRGRRKRTR